MWDVLLEFLTQLSYKEVLILVVLSYVTMIIHSRLISDEYYNELQNIHDKYKNLLEMFVRGELTLIESLTCRRAEEIVSKAPIEECNAACGANSRETIIGTYKGIMHTAINIELFNLTMAELMIGIYYKMGPKRLDAYKLNTGRVLVIKIRERVSMRKGIPGIIINADTDRFSIKEGQEFYGTIVDKAIEFRHDMAEETRLLRKQYSIFNKLNFVALILKRLKPEIDSR